MYTFFLPTLYWYCFSQPDFCADLNSAAVKPFSSPLSLQRYSFSVLYCHFPFSSSGRIVKIICAWGLCPSVSCMAKSAHIPSDTKLSLMYRRNRSIHSSLDNSMGSAATNSRASLLSLVFSASSTAFHNFSLSDHSVGAFVGSMIS